MNKIEIPKLWPVSQHSSRVEKEGTFVAIKGSKFNGLDFVESALKSGASKIVVDQDISDSLKDLISKHNGLLIKVDDAKAALADLSAHAWSFPQNKLKIIGVTGTKGKTTTTYLIRHILKTCGYKTAMITGVKNYILDSEFNSELTTPHADYLYAFLDACVKSKVEYVVMEVSAQAMSLNRVKNILFDGAIFTNLSQEHAEFYSDIEHYFNAKASFFESTKPNAIKIINLYDEWAQKLYKLHPESVVLGNSDNYISDLKYSFSGLEFNLNICNNSYKINAPELFGPFNSVNLADAFLMALSLGLNFQNIIDAIKSFNGVPGRMEGYALANGALGIVDYAHTPSSYWQVLTSLRNSTDSLIVVFGAGGQKDPIKRPIMGKIASELADIVIITNDNPRFEDPNLIVNNIKAGISPDNLKKIYIELDRKRAIELAYNLSYKNSIILVLGKGPDEYQIIKDEKKYFSDKKVLLEFQ